MDGPIKIGLSQHPLRRAKELTKHSPVPLEVLFTIDGHSGDERRLHSHFYDAHSHHEWFRPVPELLAAMERLKGGETLDAVLGPETVIRGSIKSDAARIGWDRRRLRVVQ